MALLDVTGNAEAMARAPRSRSSADRLATILAGD
jgi:hypothetical protein